MWHDITEKKTKKISVNRIVPIVVSGTVILNVYEIYFSICNCLYFVL